MTTTHTTAVAAAGNGTYTITCTCGERVTYQGAAFTRIEAQRHVDWHARNGS